MGNVAQVVVDEAPVSAVVYASDAEVGPAADVEGSLVAAAVYSRMSLDASGEGLGVERQMGLGRRLVEARQWLLGVDPAVTSDNSLSASGSTVRPGFERLLELIGSGRIRAVVAYAFDRIARNQADGVRFLELARTHRVRVAFVQGGDLDLSTPMGQFVAEMMLSIAKLEIGMKAERQRAANRQRAERGQPWKSAPRTFGWSDATTPHPIEGPEVTAAYARVLAGGSLRGIAAEWNAAGLRGTSKKGGRWRSSNVRHLLQNPRHAGRLVQAGVDYGHRWDGIVDEDTFTAVQAILDDRSTGRGRPSPRHLLSGIAECPCGGRVSAAPNTRGVAAYRHQYEPGRDNPTVRGKRHVCRVAGPVEEYVVRLVVERLSRPDAIELLTPDEAPAAAVDVTRLRHRKATLLAKAEQTATIWAATDGDSDLSRRQLAAATKAIETELADIDTALQTASSTSVLAPLVDAGDVRAVWEGLDLDHRRAVITELFARIVVRTAPKGRPRIDPETGLPVGIDQTLEIEWRR